jgi:hypothetical protein
MIHSVSWIQKHPYPKKRGRYRQTAVMSNNTEFMVTFQPESLGIRSHRKRDRQHPQAQTLAADNIIEKVCRIKDHTLIAVSVHRRAGLAELLMPCVSLGAAFGVVEGQLPDQLGTWLQHFP